MQHNERLERIAEMKREEEQIAIKRDKSWVQSLAIEALKNLQKVDSQRQIRLDHI